MNSLRPTHSIALSSLDPPGSSRRLRIPFCLTKVKPKFTEVKECLTNVEPFDTLPRALIPTRFLDYKPPLMRYGWQVSREMLLEYAQEHKILRRWGRALGRYEMMNEAMYAIQKDFGVEIPVELLRLNSSFTACKDESTIQVVSVYTNFDLRRKDLPSLEDIERLRAAFGFEGPPRWYVDSADWYWAYWSD